MNNCYFCSEGKQKEICLSFVLIFEGFKKGSRQQICHIGQKEWLIRGNNLSSKMRCHRPMNVLFDLIIQHLVKESNAREHIELF